MKMIFNDILLTESITFYKIHIRSFEENAFLNCLSLIKVVFIHSSVTKICKNAFQNISSLTALTIAKVDLSVIEDMAFTGLSSLNYLNLSYNRIEKITSYVFSNMVELDILDLTHNPLLFIHVSALDHISYVHVEFPNQCCYVKQICRASESHGTSYCHALISSSFRIVISTIVLIITVLNVFVIIFYTNLRKKNTHSVLLCCISILHISNVIHFVILIVQSERYDDQYIMSTWISHFICEFMRFLSVFLESVSYSAICILTFNTLRLTKHAISKIPYTETQIIKYLCAGIVLGATMSFTNMYTFNTESTFCYQTFTPTRNDQLAIVTFYSLFGITLLPLLVSLIVSIELTNFFVSRIEIRSTRKVSHSSIGYYYLLSIFGHLTSSRCILLISDHSDSLLVVYAFLSLLSTILDTVLFTFSTRTCVQYIKSILHKVQGYG